MNLPFDTAVEFLLGQDIIGIGLLLIKFTILFTAVLVAQHFCRRHPASFRHAVLTMGLVALPLLVTFHFFAPAWSIPGSNYLLQPARQIESVRSSPSSTIVSSSKLAIRPQNCPTSPSSFANSDSLGLANSETTDDVPSLDRGFALDPVSHANQSELSQTSGWLTTSGAPTVRPDSLKDIPSGYVEDGSPGWFRIRENPRLGTILVSVWICGMLLLLIRVLVAWIAVNHSVSRSNMLDITVQSKQIPSSVRVLLQKIMDTGIRLKVSQSERQSPLGFGFIRKTILLPSSCVGWSESQWRSVALHEYAHFLRYDCLINLVARIQQAVLWFHPLVWVFVKQIRSESENACDDYVIQSGVSSVEYADVLYHVARQSVATNHTMVATVTMSDATPLEARIKSILSTQTIRRPVNTSTLTIATLILAAFAVVVSTAQLFRLQSETAVEAKSSETVVGGLSDSGVPSIVAQPTTQLHFIVTLETNETFVGATDAEIEVESSFGQSFLKAHQIRLIKPVIAKPGEFRIEAANGSTLFGTIMGHQMDFVKDDGSTVSVKLENLKSASMVGRSGLASEQVSDGFAKNQVTYHIRAPRAYDATKQYPALVLLHGSDSNSKTLIDKLAASRPDIANRYLLIGINGEQKSKSSTPQNPRFNYTFVDFVGESKHNGVAGSDRESPALVAEVIEEIRDYVPISTIFLGGPSDGGWLTYSMYMNFPQLIDGAFPIAGAMIIQCQPDAYLNKKVRSYQRDTPIVIIHPNDNTELNQIYSTVAYERYLEDGFPMVRMMNANSEGDELGGKSFALAIAWLESMAARSKQDIMRQVEQLVDQDRRRDAIGLITRIDLSQFDEAERKRVIEKAESAEIATLANEFERLIGDNKSNAWIDAFLEFRETNEFAPSAKEVMAKFAVLRSQHNGPANLLFDEARSLFNSNETGLAYENCEQIAKKHYASKRYRYAKKKLAERDSEQSKSVVTKLN